MLECCLFFINLFVQGSKPAAGTSAPVSSPSSQMVAQQMPCPVRPVSPGYQPSTDHDASRAKGVFMPTPPTYDLPSSARSNNSGMIGDVREPMEGHLFNGGSLSALDDKQVAEKLI